MRFGHFVDKTRSVDQLLRDLPDDAAGRDEIAARYWEKSHSEKEAFAHRYADRVTETLSGEGRIPFQRLANVEAMHQNGLDPAWFGLGTLL